MGNRLADSLREAKGLLKLFAAIFCLMGALTMSSLSDEFIYTHYSQLMLFTLGLAGGCLVALALLLSLLDDADNKLAVLVFDMLYGVCTIVVGSLAAVNLSDHGIEHDSIAISVPVAALVAGVLFIVDFVRELRHV